MRLIDYLEKYSSKTRNKILKAFIDNPRKRFRQSDFGCGGFYKEIKEILRELTATGMLTKKEFKWKCGKDKATHRKKNRKGFVYKLNNSHEFVKILKSEIPYSDENDRQKRYI
jgi:hypothetical protein